MSGSSSSYDDRIDREDQGRYHSRDSGRYEWRDYGSGNRETHRYLDNRHREVRDSSGSHYEVRGSDGKWRDR